MPTLGCKGNLKLSILWGEVDQKWERNCKLERYVRRRDASAIFFSFTEFWHMEEYMKKCLNKMDISFRSATKAVADLNLLRLVHP